MVFVSENQKKKEKKKRESEEMRRDYPQIINRFSLYIGAGMSVRNAWQRITEDYRKNKERTGRRKAYEEMIYTENQMKNKAAESECYEEYGIRCGLSVYRRFGTLLSQNLRKGSKGLSELLKRETGEMFEERKKQARKLGEEEDPDTGKNGGNKADDSIIYDAGSCIYYCDSSGIFYNPDLRSVKSSDIRIDRQQYKNEQAVIQEWIGGDTKMDHSCNSRSRRENYVKCR